MATVKKLPTLSPQEYLTLEQHSDIRHELIGGQLFAMIGASNIHNLIAVSLVTTLRTLIKAPCQVYMSDMKVQVHDNFYYSGYRRFMRTGHRLELLHPCAGADRRDTFDNNRGARPRRKKPCVPICPYPA